jgi:Ca-activated chloride channel family protein
MEGQNRAMTDFINHFHFLRPEWLALTPGLLILEWLLRKGQRTADSFDQIIDPSLLAALRVQGTRTRWFTPASAIALLFGLLTLMLAGPSWRQQPSPLAENTAPLVMILDVSESMSSTDIEPSRFSRGIQKMHDLIDLTPDRPIAILAFAGSAHTVIPLTNDHEILKSFLTALQVGIVPRRGKYPEYALASVNRVLIGNPNRANVLLVTDGLGADSLELTTSWCRQQPHLLSVFGIGTADPAGSDVPLDREALTTLAERCNGSYVEIAVDTRDVEKVARGLRDSYRILDNDALPWVDGGYALLFPAMVLALLWFRRGWTRLWVWPLFLLVLALPSEGLAQVRQDRQITQPESAMSSPTAKSDSWLTTAIDGFVGLWLTPDQYGRLLLELGHYQKAAGIFDDPGWRGVAHYYGDDFARAALLFTRIDSPAALFNEANAKAHQRDYVGARKTYDAILTIYPSLTNARTNRELMQHIIEEANRLSESQTPEAGVGSEEIDPGTDPQSSEGATKLALDEQQLIQYSAEEILASPELANLWMQNVQPDPSNFLRNKFSAQYQERGVSEQ